MNLSKSTLAVGASIVIILAALAAIFMTDAPYLRGFWEGLLIGFLVTLFFGVLTVGLNRMGRRQSRTLRAQAS